MEGCPTGQPSVYLRTKAACGVYTESESKKEGGERYALWLVSVSRTVRVGIGVWNSDIRDFSGRCAPVSGGIFAHWLRLCLYAQVGKEIGMKIVIVKSPKFLKGILRMLFGIRE